MIAIIDYGMGNLRSVQKGFEHCGHEATVTSNPTEVARADKVVHGADAGGRSAI